MSISKYLLLIAFSVISLNVYATLPGKWVVDSLAKAYLSNHAGALVIGIRVNGKEQIYYYGETSVGNHKLPDSTSIFELGQLTESFTCALYADMCLKGIIKSDDKLQDFLPVDIPSPVYQNIICKPVDEMHNNMFNERERYQVNYTPYVCFPDPSSRPQQILLCDLGTHTTGLPDYPDNLKFKKDKQDPFANYSKINLYDFLKKYRFNNPVGYDYKHSHLGIVLLSHALVLKAQKDYDSLLMERILNPTQLLDTRLKLSNEQQTRLLTGYSKNNKVAPYWNFDVFGPALGLHSTASDMMKYLRLNISNDQNYFTNLMDYSHNARIQLTDDKLTGSEIGLGWKIDLLLPEKKVIWQSGSTSGFSAYMGFVETSRSGVFVLSSSAKDVNELGKSILSAIEVEQSKMNQIK